MLLNNKKNMSDPTKSYTAIPSGSRYTTCKTVFSCAPLANTCSFQSPCTAIGETSIGDSVEALNLQYCERNEAPIHPHHHHCTSSNTPALHPFNKVTTVGNVLRSSKLSLRGAIEFSKAKTSFLLVCLIFAVLCLCVGGSPISKTHSVQSHSLVKKSNETLSEVHAKDVEAASQKLEDIDLSKITSDTFSVKIKRSLGKGMRPRKGGKRKGRKRNKKPRQKRPGKKDGRRKKSGQRLSSLPLDVFHRKSSHHDLSASPRRQRLYNKMGQSFHLVVRKDGSVRGEASHIRSPYSELEIRAVGKGGKVAIKGVAAKKYICVTKRGTVKGRKKYRKSRCQFMERILLNKQNTYESLSCTGCYLNINKKGKVRKLKGANPKLTQTHFLPLRIKQSLTTQAPKYLSAKRGAVLTVDARSLNRTSKNADNSFNERISEPIDHKSNNDVIEPEFDVIEPKHDVTKSSDGPSKPLIHRIAEKATKKSRKRKSRKHKHREID